MTKTLWSNVKGRKVGMSYIYSRLILFHISNVSAIVMALCDLSDINMVEAILRVIDQSNWLVTIVKLTLHYVEYETDTIKWYQSIDPSPGSFHVHTKNQL